MSNCKGDGSCITQCSCYCYDDDNDEIQSEVCVCGHRSHISVDGHCKTKCSHNCETVECHNYKVCGKKLPRWVLNCHNDMCADCAITIGKVKFFEVVDDCPICLDNVELVQISCEKHSICLKCWQTIGELTVDAKCPLCRQSIWEWRKHIKVIRKI